MDIRDARRLALPVPRSGGLLRLLSGLGRFLSGWYSTLQTWRQRRRDIAYLSELPDYLLEDIGLTREKIDCLRGWRPIAVWRRLV